MILQIVVWKQFVNMNSFAFLKHIKWKSDFRFYGKVAFYKVLKTFICLLNSAYLFMGVEVFSLSELANVSINSLSETELAPKDILTLRACSVSFLTFNALVS